MTPLKCSVFLSCNLTFRFSNVVVGTARISTLEKRNVDCMTEKLNIFKGITSTCIYSRILGRVCAVAMVTDGLKTRLEKWFLFI